MSVYLQPVNEEETHWEIRVEFKITLLNQSGKQNVSDHVKWEFSRREDVGCGFTTFISNNDLLKGEFIENNKIQLELELATEELLRYDLLYPDDDDE